MLDLFQLHDMLISNLIEYLCATLGSERCCSKYQKLKVTKVLDKNFLKIQNYYHNVDILILDMTVYVTVCEKFFSGQIIGFQYFFSSFPISHPNNLNSPDIHCLVLTSIKTGPTFINTQGSPSRVQSLDAVCSTVLYTTITVSFIITTLLIHLWFEWNKNCAKKMVKKYKIGENVQVTVIKLRRMNNDG